MGFKRSLLQGVIVATCLSTFVAARQAPGPSSSLASPSLSSRALPSTLWNSAFAFLSIMADAWSAAKARSSPVANSRVWLQLIYFLMISPVAPLWSLHGILEAMLFTVGFRQILTSPKGPYLEHPICTSKLRRVIDGIRVIFFGPKQSQCFLRLTRVVTRSIVVLGIRDETELPHTYKDPTFKIQQWDEMPKYPLIVGDKVDGNSRPVRLNEAGKLALLESGILEPNYEQIRFLDGKSAIATLILAVQAMDYIIASVYRAANGLPVSPIKDIGFAFSILVLVHSALYELGVLSQTWLVIHLNFQQETELLNKCETPGWSDSDNKTCSRKAAVGMVVVVSAVVVFTTLVGWHGFKLSWLNAVGPILFFLALVIQAISILIDVSEIKTAWPIALFLVYVMISLGGMVVSIVATTVNWHYNKFYIQTPSLIHILPFLG